MVLQHLLLCSVPMICPIPKPWSGTSTHQQGIRSRIHGLKAIKAGNYNSWPGLTPQNTTRYCPVPVATLKGHMVQTRQNVCFIKPKPHTSSPTQADSAPAAPVSSDEKPSHELHIIVEPLSKLYTDGTRKFPVRARSGNQYIMIVYHCDSNAILAEPFKTQADKHVC